MSNIIPKPAETLYSVYVLRDPRDDSIYYVGCTTNTKKRKSTHISGTDTTQAKIVTADLLDLGMKPIFEVVDTIRTSDKRYAVEAESYWRYEMRNRGEPLVNKWETGVRYAVECKNPMDELADMKACLSMTYDEYRSAERRRKKIHLGY